MESLSNASQEKLILEWMLGGGYITSYEAVKRFGCLRLAGRIYDLKAKGYPIKRELIEVNGKRVAQYWI